MVTLMIQLQVATTVLFCGCENGFPDVENPIEELLCITVKNQTNKQIFAQHLIVKTFKQR